MKKFLYLLEQRFYFKINSEWSSFMEWNLVRTRFTLLQGVWNSESHGKKFALSHNTPLQEWYSWSAPVCDLWWGKFHVLMCFLVRGSSWRSFSKIYLYIHWRCYFYVTGFWSCIPEVPAHWVRNLIELVFKYIEEFSFINLAVEVDLWLLA